MKKLPIRIHGRKFTCSAAAIIVLACVSTGCGVGDLEHVESSLETNVSLNGTVAQDGHSAADSGDDSIGTESTRASAVTSTTGGDSNAESPAATEDNAKIADAPKVTPGADTAEPTAEVLDQADAVPKETHGTKLPSDLLEGSQLTPLNPQKTVLLDLQVKRILLRARVCLTQGLLEMLLCPLQTKEHESILSTEAQAFTVHTGLLALGCKEGKAARYDSETETYTPASGQVIDIFLHWVDINGKLHREPAQNWVRHSRQRYYEAKFEKLPADLKLEKDSNLRYDDMNQVIFWYGPMDDQQRNECLKMSADKKFQEAIRRFHKDSHEQPMTTDWVFVGSGFYQDGDSAKQYLAEGGYMICVANFAMAMLDVAIPSDSNGTESLAYEAATERIPPRESEVMIELVPRPAKQATGQQETPAADKPASSADSVK